MKKLSILIFCVLIFTLNHAQELQLDSSNLPIIVINYKDSIPVEFKTMANMRIIDHGKRSFITDSANIYSGHIGIEKRGHYSALFPQMPFGVETRDSLGENLNVPLLGMPEENDWILLANYNDKTFMRNSLACHLFNQMGHYAPRTRLCELVLNEEYFGIYLFTEKIKRDKGRVDIAKLRYEDISGDELTGGYIFKKDFTEGDDFWISKYYPSVPERDVYFLYSDPEKEDMRSVQSGYLETFIDVYEEYLYGEDFDTIPGGYRYFIDVASFVDYFIITEITRNGDGYKKSKYYYKDKDSKDGTIHSGPVWDFDWSMKNRTNADVAGTGWIYEKVIGKPNPDGWIFQLMQNPYFANEVHERYFALRDSLLSEPVLNAYIDSVHLLVDEAQERHYEKWDILGINVGTPEQGERPDTYAGEVEEFKTWFPKRLDWLDENIASFYTAGLEPLDPLDPVEPVDTVGTAGRNTLMTRTAPLRMFPNPALEFIYVEDSNEMQEIRVYNALGAQVLSMDGANRYSVRIDVSDLSPGVHFVSIRTANRLYLRSKFIKR